MQESLIEKTWPSEGISQIKVETLFGKIQIIGHESDEIRVELTGKFYGWQFWTANRNLHSDLEFYDMVMEPQGKTLVIKTALKSGLMNWLRFMGMNFRIFVPARKGFETDIKAEAGNIYAENYLGELRIRTNAGKIRLDNVRGEVNAKTSAGIIEIRHCKGEITAQTSAGTMDARNCDGTLSLTTTGGTIELREITGSAYATTSAGTIEAYQIDGVLKVSTAAGTIDIKEMRGSLAAMTNLGTIRAEVLQLGDYLNLESHSGNVKVHIPVDQGMELEIEGVQIKAPRFPGFEGKFQPNFIKGSTKPGGIPVTIKARSGNVKINAFRGNPFDSFEKTFKDTDFTLPANFFHFDGKGFLLSFAICVLMTYGFSGVLFFTLEQSTNLLMRQIYTGIVLGYFLNAALIVVLIYFFTKYYADRIKGNFSKYLTLNVAAFVTSVLSQVILGLTYWQFIEAIDNEGVTDRQPMVLYLFVPCIVASIYFFFWQRSRQITKKISEQEFQLLSLEKLKTKAELDALQARINPHFLYNALNSIAGLVHEDADKAEKMTLLLSKLFRFTIGTQDQHFNSIENELEIVRTYLEIEQVRFGNRLTYTVEVEPGLESLRIPRFLLQPVVENAVKHGISKVSGPGRIEVKLVKKQEQLSCYIYDNGPAFADNFFTGYGLQSIQDKLKLLYGENASLDIQNDDYKQVIIQIPC